MRSLLESLRRWRERRRRGRRARRLLDELFRRPDLLSGTSLRARHAGRWIHLGEEVEDGEISRIDFGILRHPRPYAFSRQSHKVIEYYTYHVREGRVERRQGVNVTRARGRDDE